jgi:hypothetical protein
LKRLLEKAFGSQLPRLSELARFLERANNLATGEAAAWDEAWVSE